MNLKSKIRTVPDWPVKGVMFRDITTLLQDPLAFKEACDRFYERYKDKEIDAIVAIDSRGFIFGAVLSYMLSLPLVPVRKKGKLPFKTVSQDYTLEYGTACVEMNEDALKKGDKAVIIDDLIATGGTAEAAARLVESLGGEVVELAFLIGLPDLKGKERVSKYPVFSIMEFEGD